MGIVSASAGTGNSDEIMSGTSMATPLTSGVAALVRQARPEYLANVVKAQLMNTANHDVFTADRKTAYGPLRVGSGRIDALAAVNNNVQLAGEDNEPSPRSSASSRSARTATPTSRPCGS